MLNKLVQTLRGTLSLLWNFHAFSYYFLLSFRFRIFLFNSVIFSRRSPTIFSAAMENRCSSFILSRFSGCILKLILRTMLTTSSGTVVGGVGFLGNRLS